MHLVDFALDQCPSNSQAGLITIHANYEGNPNYLLGTAPIYDLVPGAEQTALFAFIVPTLNIPIDIPVAVRTESDYGLRFTVQDITQLTPLAGAKLTFWGFPAEPEPRSPNAFPKARPANPAGCPGLADTSCISNPTSREHPVHPLTDNPTTCTGRTPDHDARSPDLPGPRAPLQRGSDLPGDDRLRKRDLQTGPLRQPDHDRNRLRPRA